MKNSIKDINVLDPHAESQNPRSRRLWRWLILVTVCCGLIYAAMQWKALANTVPQLKTILASAPPEPGLKSDPNMPPVTVIVQHAVTENSAVARNFVAVLQPKSDTALAFQVAGRIERRLVDTGDEVRQGDELARLVQTDFQLDLDKAMAEVQAAQQSLSVANEEEARIAQLNQTGVVSVAKLEIAQGTLQEAASRLEQAQAQLRIAQNALSYTSLIADADGVVLQKMIEPGQVVNAGQPVLRVSPTDRFEAEVALPESFGLPAPGAEAVFTAWAHPDIAIPAQLREISPIADAVTRTFQARFALEGQGDENLRYGMTGQIVLTRDVGDVALLRLPSTAIFDAGDGQGPGVWRLTADDHLDFVPVRLAHMQGQEALLQAALAPQDRVVRLGVNQLRQGLRVSPRFSAE